MEPKKSRKAEVERKSRHFFLVGLIISMGVVIAAFQWKVYDVAEPDFNDHKIRIIEDEEEADITQHIRKKKTAFPIIIEETTEQVKDEPVKTQDDPVTNDEVLQVPNLDSLIGPETEKVKKEDFIYAGVEIMPEFIGGEAALFNYIENNFEYPASAREIGVDGLVVVGFVVDEEGKIVNPEIIKGLTENLNAAAMGIVRDMPDWKPGIQNGKKVKVYMSIPLRFTLQ